MEPEEPARFQPSGTRGGTLFQCLVFHLDEVENISPVLVLTLGQLLPL
uniref:Uncharacterized protein n=1 Tax=Anguilla anguilla TaxID=7936 RepID=A0A0E9QX81_ANGAN